MKNLVAGTRRVRAIIKNLVADGYELVSWTEDGPHDSPKLEMTKGRGDRILVAVESDSIHVTPWGPGCEVDYKEFKNVAAFLK